MEGELNLAPSSPSVTESPISCCSFLAVAGEPSSSSAADLSDVQTQQILRKLHGTIDRYNDSFRSLRLALDDLELLRQENLVLRAENLGLSHLLEEREKEVLPAATPGDGSVVGAGSGIRQMRAAGKENVSPAEGIGSENGKKAARGVVPKSISIRSKGFLAAKDAAAGGGGGASPAEVGGSSDAVSRQPRSLALSSVQLGEEMEGSGIAVQVFNQGTAKTELCNKWEEMGWCPYGDLCQFAHGVDELLPVIRHPRYKTQLCRMINLPGGCPYGHRCHFRHALLPKQDS